jgi:ABC-type branched-subunit amino acid transport system ATPase component
MQEKNNHFPKLTCHDRLFASSNNASQQEEQQEEQVQ